MHPTVRPRRSAGLVPAALAVLAAAAALAVPGREARGQERAWTGRVAVQGLSVRDADDWLELRQEVTRRLGDGRQVRLGLVGTRRFGAWDATLAAGATLRPHERVYLDVDGRVTPDADVLEDVRVGARAAVPMGEVVPSLGYEYRSYGGSDVHTVSARTAWYTGPWLLSGELRVIRSAVETVNVAAIGRASRRLSDSWRGWIGLAAGEEDYRVGRPPDQSLRTLTTRSAFAGTEWSGLDPWSVRMDLSGVASDPRLDRIGVSVSVARRF